MTGVTGAAILGSGETVLIINPVLLAQRAGTEKAPFQMPGQSVKADRAATVAITALAAPTAVVDEGTAAAQKTVMVVDDSLTVRKITGRLLTREGYQVIVAKDGIDALEKLQDVTPDVVLTDVEMPRMDGFELTRNIRADESIKNMPIIMITSRTADKHRQYAQDIGVDVFLGKPYEESELLGHIIKLVKMKRMVAA